MSRLIVGTRAVLEALRSNTHIERIHAAGSCPSDIEHLASERSVVIKKRTREELDELSEGVRHQGVVAIAEDYRYLTLDELSAAAPHNAVLVALDEITDPQNFGAIVRSAVALGVHGLIVQKHRAAGVTTAATRASAGATEHANIAKVTNIQKALLSLSQSGYTVIGLDAEGDVPLHEFAPAPGGVVLVVGSEGKGLRRMVRERCETMVEIPLSGPVSSLNASVATAIAIHHVCRSIDANKEAR